MFFSIYLVCVFFLYKHIVYVHVTKVNLLFVKEGIGVTCSGE